MKRIPQYGRTEVGQRVGFERLVLAPGRESWTSDNTVTVRTEHTVTAMWLSDSGALVELTSDEGHKQTCSVNSYGQLWGGFGSLTVLAPAPYQMSLAA
jgi:hypothetical protein